MAKTVTFAVLHFSIAFAVSYLLTGDVLIGSAIALVEPAVNTVGFHFHEKVWRRIERAQRHRPSAGSTSLRRHGDSARLSTI